MNKVELVQRVAATMREKEIKKIIQMPKQVFTISDSDGNSKKFTVRHTEKAYMFTKDDVEAVIDTLMEVICDSLKDGLTVAVQGFGTFGLKYQRPKRVTDIKTGETIDTTGKYVPKFSSGKDLKMSALSYGLTLKDKHTDAALPIYVGDFDMEAD